MHYKNLFVILAFAACATASSAQAQFLDGLLKRAERAAKSEVEAKVDRETRRITRCVMGDERCIQAARRNGGTVEIIPSNQRAGSAPGQSAENAELPLVHLPLNGTVENLGSAGTASLYVPAGANQPFFIQGEEGQGLSFGKGAAVAIPYEFNQQVNPRATVTMWVRVNADSTSERELFSLGLGSGLLVTLTGKRSINLRSGSQVTHPRPFPIRQWVFVAATVDTNTGAFRIQQNDDVYQATAGESRKIESLPARQGPGAGRHHIFVGADDFNSAEYEKRYVALDDVRLYNTALSAAQVEAVRREALEAVR